MNYHSVFKSYNIKLEDDLSINKSLALKYDPIFSDTFDIGSIGSKHHTLHDYFLQNFPRLLIFPKKLAESSVVLEAIHSSVEQDNSPFDLDTCSLLSIALSVLLDNCFVVGGEISYNSKNGMKRKYLAPWASFFKGVKGNENVLGKSSLTELQLYYDLVGKAFKSTTRDELYFKLLTLYLRVVTEVPNQQFSVVKMSVPNLIHQEEYSIVNSAMLFEYVFTKEGYNLRDGLILWNKDYPSYCVSVDDVTILHSYRSIKFHANATGAISKLGRWKVSKGVADEDLLSTLENLAIQNSKILIRGIANNMGTFKSYLSNLK